MKIGSGLCKGLEMPLDHHLVWLHAQMLDKAVMAGVKEVFSSAEHRECMLHLVTNFKKRYTGKVFEDHLWAAAYSWSPYIFEKNWSAMDEANPEAMDYISKHHSKIWTRSQF